MVSIKPAKRTARFTYAERVLRAMNQITTTKRRGSPIHISTVRAQVRKNAGEENDQMGPQWSQNVSKAVFKLEDEGIVNATDVRALTFTPSGKKVIADQRNALGMAIDSADVAGQHQLAKRTLSHAPSRGAKRPRTSLPAEDVSESVSTRITRATKKPRRSDVTQTRRPSSVPPRKPIITPGGSNASPRKTKGITPRSRMTKAQLQEELESLQRSRDDAIQAAIGQEHEEGERLRAAIAKYEEELDAARAELAATRRQAGDEEEEPLMPEMSMDMDRPATPVPPSPTREIHTPLPAILRRPSGITRTQSGTIIPDLSKQPTPAPSSPGLGDDVPLPDYEDDGVFSGRNFGAQILTPDPTPHRLGVRVSRGAREMAKLQASFDRAQQTLRGEGEELIANTSQELEESEAKISALQQQITELETAITERDSAIANKEAELNFTLVAKLRVEESLSQASSRITDLEAELAFRDEDIANLNADVDFLSQRNAQLDQSLSERSQRLGTEIGRRVALDQEVHTLVNNINYLEASHQEALAQVNNALQARATEIASQAQEIGRLTQEQTTVQGRLQSARAEHEATLALAETLRNQVSGLEETISISQNGASDLRKQFNEQKSELEATTSQLDALQKERTKEQQEFEAATTKLQATLEEIKLTAQLRLGDLQSLQNSHAQVTSQRDESDARATRLQELLQQEGMRLDDLQTRFDQTCATLAQSREEVDELKAAKIADNATIENLKTSFARMKAIHLHALTQLGDTVASAEPIQLTKSQISLPAVI